MDYEHEIYVNIVTNDGQGLKAILQVSKPELGGIKKSPQSSTTIDLLTKRFEDTFPEMSDANNRISYEGPAETPFSA